MTITNEALTLEFGISRDVPFFLKVDSITAASKKFAFDIEHKTQVISDILEAGDTVYGYYGTENAATTFTVASVTETARSLEVVVNEAVAQDYHTIKWTDAQTRTKCIVKSKIRGIIPDIPNGNIYLSLQSADNSYENDEIKIVYADVTSPVTANINDLYTLLKIYVETEALMESMRVGDETISVAGGSPYSVTFGESLGTSDYVPVIDSYDAASVEIDESSIAPTGFDILFTEAPGQTEVKVGWHAIIKTE